MNVATGPSITAHDVVRIEKLQEELAKLQDKVSELAGAIQEVRNSELEKSRRCVNTGAKHFANSDDSEVHELEKQIALLRARMQCELWRGWWADIERKLADVEAAFAEFRAARELSPLLDSCVE